MAPACRPLVKRSVHPFKLRRSVHSFIFENVVAEYDESYRKFLFVISILKSENALLKRLLF